MNIAYNISQHLTLNPPLWVSRKQELKWLDGIQGGPGLIFCLAFFSKEDALFFFCGVAPYMGWGQRGSALFSRSRPPCWFKATQRPSSRPADALCLDWKS